MNEKMQRMIGSIKLGAKKNAPEILLGVGFVTGAACLITTGKASIKANEKYKELEEDKFNLCHRSAINELTEEELKSEIIKLYRGYAFDLVKNYAVPATLYVATVATIFSSYKIQKDRQLALSATLSAVTTAYATLLNKVKKGAEHGLTAKEVLDGVEVVEHVDEDGVVTTEKVQGTPIDQPFQVRFDRYATAWEKERFQNEATLKCEENWFNDRLRLQGYVFLNEVFDRLGLPRTKAGQILGWKYVGDGDGFIDFGITDCATYQDVRYDDNAWDLNFNVDGDILSDFQ